MRGNYKQNIRMLVRDEENRLVPRTKRTLAWKLEGDRILLLNGPYSGSYVHDLWDRGEEERDYIYKQLYRKANNEVKTLIRKLFA